LILAHRRDHDAVTCGHALQRERFEQFWSSHDGSGLLLAVRKVSAGQNLYIKGLAQTPGHSNFRVNELRRSNARQGIRFEFRYHHTDRG
jgi:hypothetical protein